MKRATLWILALAMMACQAKERREAVPSAPPPAGATAGDGKPATAAVPPTSGVVIKTGSINLIVTDAKAAEDRIGELLKTFGGYVASRQSTAVVPQGRGLGPSEVRGITLTLKVDARKFDAFLERLKLVGSYTQEEIRIEDVTMAYMDLNARLANQKRIEERLQAYLNDPARDYKMVLEVEKELGRVREQIETLSAQFRVLQDQIGYSTLVVSISVQPEYVPPEERTFLQEVSDSVVSSAEALASTVENLVIFAIASLPWVVPLALIGFLASWVRKRRKQSKK